MKYYGKMRVLFQDLIVIKNLLFLNL